MKPSVKKILTKLSQEKVELGLSENVERKYNKIKNDADSLSMIIRKAAQDIDEVSDKAKNIIREIDSTDKDVKKLTQAADDLGVGYDSFDPYADLNDFEDEDWQELLELQFIMSLQKQERSIKYAHKRVNWEDFADMLIQTDNFDNRYRMNIDEFNHLLGGLRDALTVSYSKSRASTTNANNKEGNGPIYPANYR